MTCWRFVSSFKAKLFAEFRLCKTFLKLRKKHNKSFDVFKLLFFKLPIEKNNHVISNFFFQIYCGQRFCEKNNRRLLVHFGNHVIIFLVVV